MGPATEDTQNEDQVEPVLFMNGLDRNSILRSSPICALRRLLGKQGQQSPTLPV